MERPDSLKVTFLGTGCPVPDPTRAGPSQVVWVGGEPLLFDCGLSTLYQLVKAGIDPSKVMRLFFTHLHSDHSLGYAHFAIAGWSSLGRKALTVYGPQGIARVTELLFGEIYREDINYRLSLGRSPQGITDINVIEIVQGTICRGDGWTVTAAKVDHSHNLECFGFRIDFEGKSVVLSGDTAYCQEVIELARGADVLVMDCNNIFVLPGAQPLPLPPNVLESLLKQHPTPQEAARMAQEAGVGKLVLTHLLPGAVPKLLLDVCREHYDGEIVVAEDLLEIDVRKGGKS